MQADGLLVPDVPDVDGNTEVRHDTVSVFNGPPPGIRAEPAARAEGLPFKTLDDHVETATGSASIGTMHLGQGRVPRRGRDGL
jgi:hypothetical protein